MNNPDWAHDRRLLGVTFPVTKNELGPVHIKSMRSDSAIFVFLQGIASAMCLLHISEYNAAGRKNGQSRRVTPEMEPCSVAHRLFGFTKFYSSRLAWPHFGQ